eukprot:742841-Pelagomonas_calceolata.AAC.1
MGVKRAPWQTGHQWSRCECEDVRHFILLSTTQVGYIMSCKISVIHRSACATQARIISERKPQNPVNNSKIRKDQGQ